MNSRHSRPNTLFIVLLLGVLNAISPFSIDMYLSAFPQIAADLNVPTTEVSLSITSYFIGLSAGQLLYGPLLDRFGRKVPLYVGLVIYLIASIACIFSVTLPWLVLFRCVQGFGGCAASVAATTMVRDFFPVAQSSKVFSQLELILGLSPLLAPTIGSVVTAAFGWQAVFISLAALVAFILTLVHRYLPDGQAPDPRVSLKPDAITRTFGRILTTPQFFTYAVAGSLSFSGLFLYVAGASIIFIDNFHVSVGAFGIIFALLSISFVGGSQINIWLRRQYSCEHIFQWALIAQSVSALLFVFCAARGLIALSGSLALLFVYLCFIGLTLPNSSALALAPFSKDSGSAASLLRFSQIGIGAALSSTIGLLQFHTMAPIAWMFLLSGAVALCVLLCGRRLIREGGATEAV